MHDPHMPALSIDAILDAAEQHQASDVFLQEGEVPRLKIREQIMLFGGAPMDLPQMAALWQVCGADAKGDMDRDSGLISRSHIRFRVNLHRTMGRLGAVMRRIKTSVPALDTLGVPDWLLTRWGQRAFGLILVTGPTGTGKSTTIASLLQWMNENLVRHIVTIEDPVEYVFTSQHSHFTQREVGRDTESFAQGLRSGMRQAPDVIFVGEIRDFETALTALQASETGLLVLATLHSERVSDTMERFLNLFPKDQSGAGKYMLAHQLVGVQCQKLVPRVDGSLQLLVEHVENGGAMRDWIYRGDTDNIQDYLRRGTDPNATSFLQSAIAAYEKGLITEEVAIEALGSETEFRRAARGIHG
jgi:twitching motility protein PilT